jgi:adenylate cyclase
MAATPSSRSVPALTPPARFRFKLRVAIAASLLLVTISLAITMTLIHFRGSKAGLRVATEALMRSSVGLVAAQTEALLAQVAARVEVCSVVLAENVDRPTEHLDQIETLLFALVESGEDLHYAQFGAPDGSFVLVRRNPEGGLDTKWVLDGRTTWTLRDPGQTLHEARTRQADPTHDYDPRWRPWYQGAVDTEDLFWTRAYAHADTGEPVVTAARTIRGPAGEVLGVVSATLALSRLNRYLRKLSASKAIVFVADERDRLIAVSEGQLPIDRSDPTALRLPSVNDAPIAAVAEFGESARASAPESGLHRILVQESPFLAVAQALTPVAGRQWTVGAVVEEASVLAEVRRSFGTSAVVAAGAIILFVLLGLALARTMAGPLVAIAQETRRIQRLELDDRRLRPSRFEEIADIQDAYTNLKTGLRAFEKYVPGRLVRTLLAERVDPEPGGREQDVTLFFSDIRGFTSFAHSVTTEELSEVLSQYLQAIVDEIDRTGGTVDKFVGDGVMAFWNAPRVVPNHPLLSVQAAIRCRDAIGSMARARELFTRIGIHTGRALIGNFGSPNRFSYTALGDAVNLASRLESANKWYGTQIMVSAATASRLDGSILLRRLDRIAVAGRGEGVDVYEVLGFDGEVDEDRRRRARQYEAALTAYHDRRFDEAEAQLQSFVDLDRAAALLAQRCRRCMARPPPKEWDGVFSLTEK